MRAKEQCDSSCAIVEIRAKADELEHLRIAEPVQSDPCRAATAADRVPRQFGRDLVGFARKHGLVRRRRDANVDARTAPAIARFARLLIEIFPDYLDLPADFVLIERLQARACAL